jgi:hypothetical protein
MPRGCGPEFAQPWSMETFNDLDFIFLLVDILVLVAGVFTVAAWYVDYRRQVQRARPRLPVIWQGE